MKWEHTEDKTVKGRPVRVYKNAQTGSLSETELIFTDKDGGTWWGFRDLYKIPYLRTAYAKHVADLYSMGLSLKDILEWCTEEKKLINSEDPEKYQKLYALILEKEKLATFTANPVRQHLALCTVYVLKEDEPIDYFTDEQAEEKLRYWQGDTNMVAFFLSWHNLHIQRYIKTLNKISEIALKAEGLMDLKIQQPGAK